jgi:hypothetical protein
VFGVPSANIDYKVSIPFSSSKKLNITYNYKAFKSEGLAAIPQQIGQIQTFSQST